jgi:hypothetical protein
MSLLGLILLFFLRQRRKRLAAARKSGLVRPPIRETLARCTLNGTRRTFPIVHAEGDAVHVRGGRSHAFGQIVPTSVAGR